MTRALALIRSDLTNILREPILLLVTCLPFIIGLIMRFGVPWLTELVAHLVDLTAHYDFMQSFALLLAPCFVGWVIGFLLLDERDEDILTVIAVTPLGRRGFLTYRLALPTAVAFVASLAILPVAGLAPFDPIRLVPVALLAALEAPMMTMFLIAFADNKVEGLVYAKGASVWLFAPLAILFVDQPWQTVAGLVPPYWVTKAFLAPAGATGEYLLALAAGVVVHGLALWLLARRFNARAN